MCIWKWILRLPVLGLVILLGQPLSSRAALTNRPNVVILFVDQLRCSEVGCYGNRVIRTPHLDRLASEGVRFTHAFANFPSCSPARSTLLSGRYARSNGLYANQNESDPTGRPTNRDSTLAEALAAAGYTTAMIGKWHLTPAPWTLGFQQSWLGGSAAPGDGYLRSRWRPHGGIGTNHIYEGYTLEHESELAADFMRQHRDRPFLLHLAPCPPHMPIASLPDAYKRLYRPEDIPLRSNVWKNGQLPFDERWFRIYLGENAAVTLPPGINLRDLHTLYYGQVTAVDDWVARVLKAVEDLGLARNTIVIFTSDHGDLLGSHQLFNKNQHYDEAIRVPLLVRWPDRIKPAVQDRQVISHVDVMPTLLELCGVKIPDTVQGTSLAPVLLGTKEVLGENVAYIETTVNEGLRTRRCVYWCNRKSFGNEHLFDVEKDPYQMKDLINDPSCVEVAAALRAKTKLWRERTPSAPPATVPGVKKGKAAPARNDSGG
jgi:arylsulfatase A-like enzyme